MTEHLIIEHFGPIPKADVDIKRFTIFIGSQGSGKSTISKLLTIFRDQFWRCAILKEDVEYVMRPFRGFLIDKYFFESTHILYNDFVQNITIEYESGKFSCRHKSKTQEELLLSQMSILGQTSSVFLQKMGYEKIDDVKEQEEFKMLRANSRTLLYIPAERVMAGQLSNSIFSIIANNVPLSNPIMEYLSFFEKAKKELSSYQIPFLNVQYKLEEGKEKVVVAVEDGEERSLTLRECSSGLQTVVPLLMVLEYCSKLECFDSFVLEEPELNLFPTNQRELLNFILTRYNRQEKSRINILITTHSPYILSIFNNYLYAAKVAQQDGVDIDKLNSLVNENVRLNMEDCAVYSLGNDGESENYCKSVISEETGLIDFNYLDNVSCQIGEEFEQLQMLSLQAIRTLNKK